MLHTSHQASQLGPLFGSCSLTPRKSPEKRNQNLGTGPAEAPNVTYKSLKFPPVFHSAYTEGFYQSMKTSRNFQPSSPSPLATALKALLPQKYLPSATNANDAPGYNQNDDDRTNDYANDEYAPDDSAPEDTPTNYNSYSTPGAEDAEDDGSHDPKSLPLTLLARLLTFPLFKDAPKSFHTRVGAKLRLVQYHPTEYIIKEGDPALSMYWILKGTVSVTSTDGESVYAELAPGSFFGEIGILFNRPRTATVVARLRVLVGVLTADSLNVVLRLYPLIERRIRDEAQERLAMQDKKNRAEIPILKPSKSPVPSTQLPQAPSGPSAPVPLPLSQIVHAAQTGSCALPLVLADNVDQTVSIQEFIKLVPMFRHLPLHIIHRLALGVEPINYKPFEYIFRKGDRGSDIYFVTHGEVEVVDYRANNIEKVLARLKHGAYFGEMSFLDRIHGNSIGRSATIRSVTLVELIVIRTDMLETVCLQYPQVADEMRRTADERKNFNQSAQLELSPRFPLGLSMRELNGSVPSPSRSPLLIQELTDQPADPKATATPTANQVVAPQPNFFNPYWSFSNFNPLMSKERNTSSVSPVSSTDTEASAKTLNTSKSIADEHFNHRKRKSISDIPQQLLLLGPLDISVPPMNAFVPLNVFLAPNSRRHSFQYMPHNKRIRLAEMAGRRRSSVLVSAGSIPDKILLKVFEYLPLPELMKLRIISRRWRQLLYVAPNLFQRLDLTPWNTSVDDSALISITDFVGSRPQYIDISNCFHVTDEGFSYMVNEIGMSGNIKVLKMRSIWEVSAMAIMDLTSPSVGKHLEEVDVSNCRKVKDNVVERLIGWTNEGPQNFQQQNSDGSYHNDTGSKHLKILNLGYCKHLTDNIMYHISLHANERLESLDLTRCTTITDAGFQYWTYRSFPNLKKLSLKDCTFLSDKSIISLANAAPNLEILDLNFCCTLLDIAIEVLCLGCQKLRELDLSFCGSAVSDSSLVAISLHLCHLEKLVVKGCVRVTRAGVDALLSGYSPLHYINISQCRNAHEYPGHIPAQTLKINPATKSAFITAGPAHKIIEIVP